MSKQKLKKLSQTIKERKQHIIMRSIFRVIHKLMEIEGYYDITLLEVKTRFYEIDSLKSLFNEEINRMFNEGIISQLNYANYMTLVQIYYKYKWYK